MTIIDAHQHVWDLSRAEYAWLTSDLAPIDRTITFDELRPQLVEAGVDGTVLVQSADNVEDTALMFETARLHPEVLGVVGYVPLDRPQEAAAALEALVGDPLFVGVRNLIHDIPDPDWLLRPEVDEGLGLLERADVPFDLVAVLPRHLELVPLLGERHPQLRIVIDHLAKPPIGATESEPWASLMRTAAENPNVLAKVSGLYSAVGESGSWSTGSVRPYVEHALEWFGADRLLYGGDWPISMLSGGYRRVWQGLAPIFDALDVAEREAVLGGTAIRFYGLDAGRLDAIRYSAGH